MSEHRVGITRTTTRLDQDRRRRGRERTGSANVLAVGVLLCGSFCYADTFTYRIDVVIRYDLAANGVTYPDTPVWGLPVGVAGPSGTLELAIDEFGNVSGASPADPLWGLGMLWGQRLYALHNATLQISDASWGTPVANNAPLTGGTVDLGASFLGDFTGMKINSGFIKDGNSGDFFNLSNGVGADGKLEFTATGSDGISVTFKSENWGGFGTGWYTFAVDTGDMSYSNGTDAAAVGITGRVSYPIWIDAGAATFFMEEQILLENSPGLYTGLGKRIDSFSGVIDATGTFVGTAHFAGIDFTSLTASTTDGTFEDGNSPGFDIGNGLVEGDTFTTVMVDSTGLFDLIIFGTMGSCTGDAECDDGIVCTDDFCDDASACQHVPNDGSCDDGDVCSGMERCQPTLGCQPGQAMDCDDGIPCTIDSCDSTSGCQNLPNNNLCDDGKVCTDGSCNGVTGCVFTPVTDCVVPAASEWGVVMMALLLLTSGTLMCRRCRPR